MRHAEQVKQIHALFAHLEEQTTDMANQVRAQATTDYHCADHAALEQRKLFRTYPMFMGLSCELPNPGDFLTDDFNGMPVALIRQDDGKLAAFLNICLHRGARILTGRGRIDARMHCPYHAWSYERNGTLAHIPHTEAFDAPCDQGQGLTRLPAAEVDGLMFVSPDRNATLDLDSYLNEFKIDLKEFKLPTYHHFETRELHEPINWKLVVDTFLETYHLSTLHRKTIAPILHSNLSTFKPMGRHLRLIAARKTIDELKSQPESQWNLITHSALVYILFPNTVFIMQGDHLETWRVYPDTVPGKSRMHISLYTPEPTSTEAARQHWDRNFELLMATVLQEDFPLARNMQRDFPSRAEPLAFGRNEPALQYFHEQVDQALT